jgi:hypothetical protein
LLDRISTTGENDIAIETTKSYITEILRLYQPKTAIDLCKITPPTNGDEQAAAIKRLQKSLLVLSNVKAILGYDEKYKQTIDAAYIARFIQSGYALIFEEPLGSLQLKGFLMILAK